jgi:signal transduction histidine kinase/CheY-like chemotaxis protein
MRFRHLQNYVGMIMVSSALVLSTIFSLIAYQLNQRIALEESERQVLNLMAAVKNTASAALFSSNETVAWDAINGLLGTDVVYSAELEGFADEFSKGMKISSVHENGGEALGAITLELESIFDNDQILGVLRATPNKNWVNQRTRDISIPTILGVIFVIAISFFVSAHALKVKIAEPLVKVRKRLKEIHADSTERLSLPDHLKANEIGVLVDGFNELLDETNAAFLIERRLRKQMQDVQNSLKKAKAEAEMAAQAKSDFLATMSHEIRTPLSGVLGMLGFALKDTSVHDKTRAQLDIAHSNAKALLTIINDILDLSKMEAGKLNVELVDFDIRREVNAAVAVFGDMAKDKSLYFKLNFANDVPQYVKSDPTRIRQVLVNLIGNAIKFTSFGGVTVNITLLEMNGDNIKLDLSVRDSGIGITQENIGKLFQKFEQADVSTTRKYGGTGLGLSICKQLVELMGGTIEVTSVIGDGSNFHFELPLEISSAEACEVEVKELLPHSHKLNVLCAEDFVTNQIIIRTLLEDMGHHVDIAENGKEALDKLQVSEYDIVLMDGRMPEMDGLEATRVIRKGEWNNKTLSNHQIKVVALTANVTDEDKQNYLKAGMNDFLRKPVDEQELHHVLSDTIDELLKSGKKLKPLIRASLFELDNLFGMPPEVTIDKTQELEELPKPDPKETLAVKLRAAFVESLPERIEEISIYMKDKNCHELGRIFHGIKGSAGYLKDEQLESLAGGLEVLADANNISEIEESLSNFMGLLVTYR